MKEFKSAHSRMFNKRRQQQQVDSVEKCDQQLTNNTKMLDNQQVSKLVHDKGSNGMSDDANLLIGKLDGKMMAHSNPLSHVAAAN